MFRKIVFIMLSVCLLAASNHALAYDWNPNNTWERTIDSNWFNPGNWYDTNSEPNIYILALVPSNSPGGVSGPIIDGDACCMFLSIEPWSQGRSYTEWGVDMNSGTLDCNYGISIGAGQTFSIADGGIPTFTVHGGTVRQLLSTGDGVLIGGGGDGYGSTFGKLYMYGGYLTTPRLELRHGEILLYGGTLECTGDSNFIFYQDYPENKIDLSGGTFILAGSHVTDLTTYIANGRIVSTRGTLGTPTYDGSAWTTLTSTGNLQTAWNPQPVNGATEVSYKATNTVTLTWNKGDIFDDNSNYITINHVVYFGTSATSLAPKASIPDADPCNDPCSYVVTGPFAIGATYYWEVNEYNTVSGVNTPGPVWHFKTQDGYAYNPKPQNTQVGLKEPLTLTWTAGNWAATHAVYFGTSATQVYNALGSTSAPAYRGSQAGTSYSLSNLVPNFTLTAGNTYYWAIEEVNGANSHNTGDDTAVIWSFTAAPYINIDDFEDYITTNDLNALGDANVGWLTGYSVYRKNGSCTGTSLQPAKGKLNLVLDSAGKHMNFTYLDEPSTFAFSEVNRPYIGGTIFSSSLISPTPAVIRVDYIGSATNAVDPCYDRMYIALEDTAGNMGVVYNPDANAATVGAWTTWYTALNDGNLASVNKAAVVGFHLGFGNRLGCMDNESGGDGNVMFDNIRLYAQTCNTAFAPPADLDGDCDVDINDLDIFANDWLNKANTYTFVVTAPKAPVLWYKFNDSTGTSITDYGKTGSYTGTVINPGTYAWNTTGGRNGGGCLYLPSGQNSYVSCPTSTLSFMSDANHAAPDGGGVTFSMWMNADVMAPEFQNWGATIIIGNALSSEASTIACPYHNFGTWGWAGWWKSESPTWSWGPDAPLSNFGPNWNHWVFVKEPHAISFYCNGNLVGHEADTDSNQSGGADAHIYGPLFTPPATSFAIGTRWWAYWVGRIADFQVYDYALNANEVGYLATDGTGSIVVPLASKANFYLDGGTADDANQIVNFEDLSVMGIQWHALILWP